MEVAIKESDEVKEFIQKREELAKEYAVKDSKGNFKTMLDENSRRIYVIPDMDDLNSPYRKRLKELEETFAKDVKDHEEKVRKYNEEFLLDDSEFKPFMIDIELLEQYEKCPQAIMDLIHWMIKDTE
jgi:hypothetical protein